MAVPAYLVKIGGTAISNVQEFTVTQGVKALSTPIRPGTGTVYGRRPDLLPTVTIGASVEIRLDVTGGLLYYGRVADFRVIYGIVSSMDTWELDVEDAFATLGRCTASFSWSAGSTTSTAMQTVGTGAGVTISPVPGYTPSSPCSAQIIINENALEVFSRLLIQEQGFWAISSANQIDVYGRNFGAALQTYDLSDDGTGTNPIKYDSLNFAGLADNYADKTIVEASGLAQQSAGIGNYSAIFQTYNQTTGQAKDLADYLLGVYDAQVQNVSSVTAVWQANTSGARTNLNSLVQGPAQVKIKFRSTIYYGIVIGRTVTGTIDDVRYTYYLAAPSYYVPFTLNSAQFGVLDTNRLGY